MRSLRLLFAVAVAAGFSGCIHLRGVVVEERSNAPVRTARITVGRPGGIAVFDSHDVDERGQFDFYIAPTDDNNVYVYDTAGPVDNAMRLDRREISEKMKIRLRKAAPERPDMNMSP